MSKERAHLNLDDDLDLSGFEPKQKGRGEQKPDMKVLQTVAEQAGFPSREPRRRRRRQRSPYQAQLNLKCREDIKSLFHAIGDRMDLLDHTTFELALLALLEKQGYSDLIFQYKDITK
jgi:hypothetical protein